MKLGAGGKEEREKRRTSGGRRKVYALHCASPCKLNLERAAKKNGRRGGRVEEEERKKGVGEGGRRARGGKGKGSRAEENFSRV